jgi:hypothetical protein
MSSWFVRLTGATPDLNRLLEGLPAGNLWVTQAEGDYWLGATELGGVDDAEAAKARAEEIIAYLNGLAKTRIDDFREVRFAGLKRVNGEERQYRWVEDTMTRMTDSVSLTVTHADGTVEQVDTAIRLDADTAVAMHNESVQQALRLFGAGDRQWGELYKVLEIIEADVGGGSAIDAAGWVSAATLRRFTHTANSVGALGAAARHARETKQPPRNPMLLDDAVAMIRDLLGLWIASKR